MAVLTDIPSGLVELDQRTQSDGLTVTLLVEEIDFKQTYIAVEDAGEPDRIFTVPPTQALDAFAHPFRYAHR